MLIAHLGQDGGDPDGLAAIQEEFAGRNPGYRLDYLVGVARLDARDACRVVFVQGGTADAAVEADGGERVSPLGVGDAVLLRPDEALCFAAPLDVLVFVVPAEVPAELPSFLRPDQDPSITDSPGGCATDEGAYRRILLTWLGDNGPYRFRALNAHRVRMTDSFSHYHPMAGGFDELYLVQHVRPGGRLYTSRRVGRIERPDAVTAVEAAELVDEVRLAASDLVYIGRGEMHRAVGGVLAHVITVPGFVPGAEIGVDHHLRAINERLGLGGSRALPLCETASDRAVVK